MVDLNFVGDLTGQLLLLVIIVWRTRSLHVIADALTTNGGEISASELVKAVDDRMAAVEARLAATRGVLEDVNALSTGLDERQKSSIARLNARFQRLEARIIQEQTAPEPEFDNVDPAAYFDAQLQRLPSNAQSDSNGPFGQPLR